MSIVKPNLAGLVTFRYVVMSFLNRKGDYSLKNYKRYLQIAIEGYSEMCMWHIDNGLEVVYLKVSDAMTANLPADYITYTKIGVPENGKIRILTKNNNILLPRLAEDGEESFGNTDAETEGLRNLIYFSGHFRNGRFVGGLYGLPGGIDNAYYRIDMERRQILFSGNIPKSYVVLEYISSGVKTDGSTLIPREAIPALRAYLDWQDAEHGIKSPSTVGEARMISYNIQHKKALYEEEVEALRSFQHAFTAEEYKRTIYSSMMQTPKR
jgi:hypothetical protein